MNRIPLQVNQENDLTVNFNLKSKGIGRFKTRYCKA